MAFVERYITHDAAGGNDGTQETDAGGGVGPWTLTEWFGHTEGSDRRGNIKEGSYSIGATTIQQAGDATTLSVTRGYSSTIGDLEGQGRNADGTLDTTNFPAITLTGRITCTAFILFEALNISGAVSSELFGTGAVDDVKFIQCKILNTQNTAASPHCIDFDDDIHVINCDLECSGADHGTVCQIDNGGVIVGCRFSGQANVPLLVCRATAIAIDCQFIGNNTGIGVDLELMTSAFPVIIKNSGFYLLDTAVRFPNSASGIIPTIIDCHPTDCAKYIDNLYIGTANIAVIEINNRTRDNITPRTGIGDGVNIGEIIDDDGGPETDYTDAGAGNFRLIDGAPGVEAALIAYADCGAYQKEPAAAGGGLLTHPGMTGNVNA